MEHRVVRLVVPGRAARSMFVDSTGDVPRFSLSVDDGDTTVAAVVRTLLPTLNLGARVVDCFIDQSQPGAPTRPVPVLVEVPEPDPDWPTPDGWHEVDADRDFEIEIELAPRLREWIDERYGRVVADPLRPAWVKHGWFERASDWIVESMAAAGLPAPTAIVQHRHWGISAVMRVDTDTDRYWFKAVSEHFRREAAITTFLARELSGATARVIASELGEGWLLLGDLGRASIAPDEHDHRAAYEQLVRIQSALEGRAIDLIHNGCDVRPLAAIPGDFAAVLDDPIAREWIRVDSRRGEQLVDWLNDAVDQIERLAIPDVFVHGDFHPGNVAVSADRRLVFDWSDAAIAKPFVDVVTWATWMPDDAVARDALWRSFAAVWSHVLPTDEWLALRPTLEGVAGAYHVVSYAGIVKSLDPLRRPEHGGGLMEFAGFLDAAVPT
jgi:hypothetical protein